MEIEFYEKLVHDYVNMQYLKLLREPKDILKHKFIVPGSVYENQLWDWDSWLTDIAVSTVANESNTNASFFEYQKGCILNFLDNMTEPTGGIPITICAGSSAQDLSSAYTNCSKPILAQHTLFICRNANNYSWIKSCYDKLKKYIGYYENFCRHESGLYYFIDDYAIGVDNDPCTFYRPKKSSASIFLNCLMYKELLAFAKLAEKFERKEDIIYFTEKAESLKKAINLNCYDERNGFYYSVDLNLLPIDQSSWLHSGCPRHWNTLIQRIDVWSGFLAMWAGIADEKQAKRMVNENYLNKNTFNAPYGVRSLSKCEKMYMIKQSSNPSCWLGPVWGCVNYFVFRGLLKYGYNKEAEELANKTIMLFGKDIESCGEMHEYYDPDSGEGISNQGFQSWNLLVNNMIAWKNGQTFAEEF